VLFDETISPANQTDDTQNAVGNQDNDVDMDDIVHSYSNDIVGGRMYVLRQSWMAIQGTLHDAILKFNI
jgi:enhancing lycopene biosynthesis protein 2